MTRIPLLPLPWPLAWLPLLAAVLLAAPSEAKKPVPEEKRPFVFVSLPDTQIYADDRFPDPGRSPAVTDERGTGAIFFDQTRWIVDNARALDVRYVGHLGDIVQDGNDLDEWALAHEAMDLLLEADIPHGTVMGNHDDNHGPDYQRNYLEHFGPQVFADRPWYTASSPGGGANLQLLEHGPYKIGFLNFSIDHPRSEVEWAQGIVEANRDTIFVIGTHRYLYDFKLGAGRYGQDVATDLGLVINLPQGFVPGVTDGLTAQELFDEFVSTNPNVLMIHAGHFHSEWLNFEEENLAGERIVQILTDYQSTRNGGDGYLRLYELDFETQQLRFHTYSPTLDRRRTVIDHFVETIFLIWDERAQVKELLGVSDDVTYIQLVRLILKQNPGIPDDFLDAHPDYDEPHERAYYQTYMEELFHGDVPPDFVDITEWQNLWFFGFAADPDDLGDFSDGPRSPSGVVPVDFSRYFTPSPEQQRHFAFEAVLEAIRALSPSDLLFRGLGRKLERSVEFARKRAERGALLQARHVLEGQVLVRTDGCAERGEPDPLFGFFWSIFQWFWAWFNGDFVVDCAAQATVHGPLVELIDLLE